MAISTSQSIRDNAQYHAELIKSLEELQYAPSALTQQTSYLTDLEKQLRTTKENALENEMRERGNMKMIEDMIEEGKRVKDDLTAKSLALHQIEQELETLYENIFGGPTQEFPRDDQLENQLMSAQEAYDRIQGHMNAQSQAVNLLGQADKAMASCLQSMQVALGYSSWDVFGGGGMADMMERSALGEASAAASRAQMLVDQAQRTSPDVQSVGPIRLHEISLFGDVFFDNVYSDIVAHQKMEANRNELMNLHDRIKRELRAATARCQRIGPDLVEAAEVLSQCRQDLAQFRKDTFNRVSGFGPAVAGDSSLPSYQESPSSFPNPQQTYYPPPDGPPPASSSSAIIQYSPPAGPPPGHTRSSSSVSAAKDLPSLPQSETGTSSSSQAYQPPPGPPPGHSANVQYSSPAGPPPAHLMSSTSSSFSAHPTGGVLPNYAGSTKDLPTLPQSETGSSPSQDHQVPPGLPPSHSSSSFAPAHWGSRNPFAMTLMGQYAHQTEGEENGKK
ncbi:hypothetical protein WG66_010136 [Moniliophthora roreri]|nr:hypothetical protein WG66_010136 [Moniliophthora roreri]